ncbi:MAG: multidrug efflux RND transporter permease subunit [Nibricoccus sp.]
MSKFFINRPIVAMVISIIMVIVGVVAMLSLPIAQFPNIVPPQVQVVASYVGADAQTVEQAVATPIEQQVSGVDNMEYMYSVNANDGTMTLNVFFGLKTDPNTDQILTQLRVSQAESQVPSDVRNYGITVKKSLGMPLLIFALTSPNGTYDAQFLANYAKINFSDQLTRVPGIASVTIFGAGDYAMRLWVHPDQLAKLGLTIPEIVKAVQAQNTVNPAGQIGGEPIPKGQEFTYSVRAQGRLSEPEEFANIVVRANSDGSIVRVKDVARVELGAQNYSFKGRVNNRPAAVIMMYQLPGSNALQAAEGAKALIGEIRRTLPEDLELDVALDTTTAVTEGMEEIVHTLVEAMILVIIVVFIFLQGWRATLIPLLAVPVSLIGTFIVFPLLGFYINTLSLFGLVLAIGLVVDDAIVVVEAVEHHIEHGLSPRDATLRAMEEVSGPVIAIALILSAVFIPTAFIPGITGTLYQQFAVTIAISVIISAFNALTLSPALSALLLRPRKKSTGLLQRFFDWFNRVFGRATNGYVSVCRFGIRKFVLSLILLAGFIGVAGWMGKTIPTSFLPEEDQGYIMAMVQLPDASSLQRTEAAAVRMETAMMKLPGVDKVTTVIGYNMLTSVKATYNATFFIVFKPWAERKKPEEKAAALLAYLNRELAHQPEAIAFAFSPPAIPGIGTAGGVTFMLQDRSGRDIAFLKENVDRFAAAARERPEIASVGNTFLPTVPQVYVKVDRDKTLKQGVPLDGVYQTLQTFMGGYFVNYFNRFGRTWQVYVQAEGQFRTQAENLGQFYVKNDSGSMVPLSALTQLGQQSGPEFTMRYNLYRSAQLNVTAKPGISSAQAMSALEDVFAKTMPREMGYAYSGMSYQEKKAQEGISPMFIFGMSFLFVFLILAAQYESWALPFSVLLATPIAVFGAFAGLMVGQFPNNIYAQIGLVMLIGLSAKNAILIVEFAKMQYEQGKPLLDAALEGARLRLRPILMTSFAFILGCVPLVTASGAGSLSRQVMGFTVIGGMLLASFIAIFFIPMTYYVVERIKGARTSGGAGNPLPSPNAPVPHAAPKPQGSP